MFRILSSGVFRVTSLSVSAQGSILFLFFLSKQLRQTGIALDIVLSEDGCVGGQPVGGTGALLSGLARGAVGMQPGQDGCQVSHHFRSLYIVEDFVDYALRLFKYVPSLIGLALLKPKICY